MEILDVNDHRPEFLGVGGEASSTSGRFREIVVDESVSVGQELGRLFAVDADSGVNGQVNYRIREEDGVSDAEIFEVFELSATTGVLRTRKELDRETRETYEFQVNRI